MPGCAGSIMRLTGHKALGTGDMARLTANMKKLQGTKHWEQIIDDRVVNMMFCKNHEEKTCICYIKIYE